MRYDERIAMKRVSSLIPREARFTTNLLRISPSLMLCFLVVLHDAVTRTGSFKFSSFQFFLREITVLYVINY